MERSVLNRQPVSRRSSWRYGAVSDFSPLRGWGGAIVAGRPGEPLPSGGSVRAYTFTCRHRRYGNRP